MSEAAERSKRPIQVRTTGDRPLPLAERALISVSDAQQTAVPVQQAASVQTVIVLPAIVNLEIYEGDDFFLDVAVTDVNSNPVNVTNLTPMSQIRVSPDGPAVLANIGITVDATITNLIHLHLAAIDSNNLPANCAWDLQLSTPNVTTLCSGSVTVTPQVTQ